MSFELSPKQLSQLVICPSCYRLREVGAERPQRQRCRCEPRPPNEPVERLEWSLCFCCGIEPVPSGFRFAPLHCDLCRARVIALNRALGRCAIPIGAHSTMNGIALSTEEVDQPTVERFQVRLLGFFVALEQLDEWARTVARENLGELGFPTGREVRLSDYLDASRGRVDQERAFERLCAHFASQN